MSISSVFQLTGATLRREIVLPPGRAETRWQPAKVESLCRTLLPGYSPGMVWLWQPVTGDPTCLAMEGAERLRAMLTLCVDPDVLERRGHDTTTSVWFSPRMRTLRVAPRTQDNQDRWDPAAVRISDLLSVDQPEARAAMREHVRRTNWVAEEDLDSARAALEDLLRIPAVTIPRVTITHHLAVAADIVSAAI